LPVRGSIFCAVPVLPAAVYPAGCACWPVPVSTTRCSIFFTFAQVSTVIARPTARAWNFFPSSPPWSTISDTMKGFMSMPPFASAQ
jgi:hypothetical protein